MAGKLSPQDSGTDDFTAISDINVTPFVDVVLVLLVIFMVTAPMLTAGVNVDLPKADASPLPGQDEPLSVSVSSAGKIFIQKTEVQLKELAPKLEAISNHKHDTRIFVRGDKNVDYGRVMQVVAQVSSAGWVFSVRTRSVSGPSKHSAEIEYPSASSAR